MEAGWRPLIGQGLTFELELIATFWHSFVGVMFIILLWLVQNLSVSWLEVFLIKSISVESGPKFGKINFTSHIYCWVISCTKLFLCNLIPLVSSEAFSLGDLLAISAYTQQQWWLFSHSSETRWILREKVPQEEIWIQVWEAIDIFFKLMYHWAATSAETETGERGESKGWQTAGQITWWKSGRAKATGIRWKRQRIQFTIQPRTSQDTQETGLLTLQFVCACFTFSNLFCL